MCEQTNIYNRKTFQCTCICFENYQAMLLPWKWLITLKQKLFWLFRVFCIGKRLIINSTNDKLFAEGQNLCLNFTILLVHRLCICFVMRLENENLQKWLKSVSLFAKLLLKSEGYSSILKVNILEFGINPKKMLVFSEINLTWHDERYVITL